MPADDFAGEGIDDRSGLRAQPFPQEALGVAVGDEADVVAVRLVRDTEPAGGCRGADLRLGEVPERQDRPSQLARGQDGQHVGLILGGVG